VRKQYKSQNNETKLVEMQLKSYKRSGDQTPYFQYFGHVIAHHADVDLNERSHM